MRQELQEGSEADNDKFHQIYDQHQEEEDYGDEEEENSMLYQDQILDSEGACGPDGLYE